MMMSISNISSEKMDSQLFRLRQKILKLEKKLKEMKAGERTMLKRLKKAETAIKTDNRETIERKKAEEQIVQKNLELSKLFRISLQLLESLDKKTVLQKIADNSANLVGTDTCAIYIIQGEDLLLEATSPPLPVSFPEEFRLARIKNHPHIQKVAETGNAITITDASKAILTAEEKLIMSTRRLASLVYIPLFVQKKVKGVIILGTINRIRIYEQHEIDLFITFSNITSLALENSYLFENLLFTKDKAEESNRLKSAFLHNISHEIRTPLNAIIGFSDLLANENLSGPTKKAYNDIILQSNNQLLSIIDEILNISHIETNQVVLTETRVDLKALLRNIYLQYHAEAKLKRLELKLNYAIEKPEMIILADEHKLIGIITNLLNNAFKFTHEGTVELGCSRFHHHVKFYVKDTGIGISESEQSKIFDRFYQIDNCSHRLYGGMGLGLSICNAYIKLMGGKITVASVPGKGSKFTFTIPFKKADQEIRVEENNEPALDELSKRTILVAEDDDTNYAYIKEILSELGYKTIRVCNGSEAIDACSSNQNIDLILMDIRMPVKDGYESAHEILKIRPHIPIIAQTAYGYPDDRSRALEKGCIDLITKPFNMQQLASVVKKHLR